MRSSERWGSLLDAALIGATAVLAGMVMALGCQKIYGYDIPPFPKSYRHASGVTQARYI